MQTVRSLVSLASLALCAAVVPAAAQSAPPDRTVAEQRYQIGVMERVLEGAVEHGATIWRDRLQAVVSAQQMLILENARVRGFRLDGYGVFFDVEVPSLSGTLTWSLRTLDQNDLGLQSALSALKKFVDSAGDVNLRQALERVELQVGPMPPKLDSLAASDGPGARTVTGSAALVPEPPAAGQQPSPDPILDDPNEAYRAEVIKALEDAMLDHSSSLGIGSDEWLTVAARRNEQRPRLAPADSGASTFVIRVRGADLSAFRAGQISREEAAKRFDVRVF